jgi:hypothetical protein
VKNKRNLDNKQRDKVMTPSFNKDMSKIMASIVPTDASAYGESSIQVGSDKKVQPKKSSFSSAGSTILDLLTGEYAKNQPWSKNDEKDKKDSKKISDPIVKKLDEIKNILKQVLQKTKDSKQEAKKEAEKLFKQKSQTYETRTVARPTQPSGSITPTTSIVTKSVATEQKIPTVTNQDKPEESKDEPTDGRSGLFDFLTDKTKGVGKTAGKVLRKTGDLFKKINPGVLKGGAAALGGLALGAGATKLKESGYEKLGGATDIASDALTWGGTGAALGSVIPGVGTAIGAGVGAAAGGAYGLYKNWNNIFGGKSKNVESAKNQDASMSSYAESQAKSDIAERNIKKFERENPFDIKPSGNIDDGSYQGPRLSDPKKQKEYDDLISKASQTASSKDEKRRLAEAKLLGIKGSDQRISNMDDTSYELRKLRASSKFLKERGIDISGMDPKQLVGKTNQITEGELESKVYQYNKKKLEGGLEGVPKEKSSFFNLVPPSEATQKYHAARSTPDAKMVSSPEIQGARSASMLGKDINKMSVENRALEREAQTPQVAQPIVSNNVVSNNTQSIVPIKAQTRVESSFSDYMRRTAAY